MECSKIRRVKLLPDNLINRIAAGEVIERPAAVLKELVENSLDSGADRIDIEVESGGKRLIRVRDNGRGMDQDDLLMCLERHATSKIDGEADLFRIDTLGFRGEALPSIGSVSRLSITSAAVAGEGHMAILAAGRLEKCEPVPANRGTTVEVRDLFYNVPARRKFLKTEPTESAHLLEVARSYALSRDGLSLTFKDGGREVLSVESRHDFASRVYRVLGRAAAESLIPFEYRQPEGDLRISGWLGSPERAQRSTANVYVYVLGRPVRDRLLNRALVDGYARLLSPGAWPAAVVFIDPDPAEVDVNVHPAKAEVRFRQPGLVFSAVSAAVARAVGKRPVAAAELRDPFAAAEDMEPRFDSPPPWMRGEDRGGGGAASGEGSTLFPRGSNQISSRPRPGSESPAVQPGEVKTAGGGDGGGENAGSPPADEPAPAGAGRADSRPGPGGSLDLTTLKPLGQLYQSYILAQGEAGLYIIDQHAAHERIMYNQLREKLEQGLPSQALLFPDTMDLPPREALAAEKLTPHLERLGFDLKPFGDRTFILKSAPAILGGRDPWPPLLEILGAASGRLAALEGAGLTEALNSLANSWIYSLACRAAVKAGDALAPEAMEQLIADMAATPNGAYCPHGRPAVQLIGRTDIERKFDRR